MGNRRAAALSGESGAQDAGEIEGVLLLMFQSRRHARAAERSLEHGEEACLARDILILCASALLSPRLSPVHAQPDL